jgi:hypothetical protein
MNLHVGTLVADEHCWTRTSQNNKMRQGEHDKWSKEQPFVTPGVTPGRSPRDNKVGQLDQGVA